MIIALFAVDESNGMGLNGSLPWPRNSDDMKWFKNKTTNEVVVMGRKTWESSMPTPLPNRYNVVVTSKRINNEEVTHISGDVCSALKKLQRYYPYNNIFVIGGADVLQQANPVIERALVTRIPGKYSCDTHIDLDAFLLKYKLVNTIKHTTCTIEEYEAVS